ncbi:MAG: flippase-like domain-containing protein [Firmicutes bacterium]|nr:flippase-like domain-containing protein [Bacillota bacterium]
MPKKLGIILKVIVSITLIYFVARKMDLTAVVHSWKQMNPWYMLLAYVLMLIAMVVNSIKWQSLLKVQKIDPGFKKIAGHYLVGYFFNNFLTGVGEVKRIYDLSKESGKPHEVVASVFIERWTGVICQVSMALIAMGWAYGEAPGLKTVLIICAALFAVLLILFVAVGYVSNIPFLDRFQPVHRWLITFRQAYHEYTKAPMTVVWAMFLSVIPPVLLIFIHWFLTLGLGYNVSLWSFVLFMPIISVFSQVPVSINGIGVQELLFVQLFGILGIAPETAFSVSIMSHVLKMGVGLIGGAIFMLRKDHSIPEKDVIEEEEEAALAGESGK